MLFCVYSNSSISIYCALLSSSLWKPYSNLHLICVVLLISIKDPLEQEEKAQSTEKAQPKKFTLKKIGDWVRKVIIITNIKCPCTGTYNSSRSVYFATPVLHLVICVKSIWQQDTHSFCCIIIYSFLLPFSFSPHANREKSKSWKRKSLALKPDWSHLRVHKSSCFNLSLHFSSTVFFSIAFPFNPFI